MSEIQITRIAADDEDALIGWNDLMRIAYTCERSAAWWRSPDTTVAQFARPRIDKEDIALIAHLDDEPVGGAEINLITDCPATVELGVLPPHRRRKIGTALAEEAAQFLGNGDRS